MNNWTVQTEHNTITRKQRYTVRDLDKHKAWTTFDSSNNIILKHYRTHRGAQNQANRLNKQEAINDAWKIT
jgi:hypothetical protein